MSETTTDENGWRTTESPREETLLDVVGTRDGPYVVGEGGVVLTRDEGWTTVLGAGPATKHNRLTCAAVTEDRNRVWFAGDSGALGVYDTQAQRKYDYTAPNGKTSTWEAIGVAGTADDEYICVANGSGEVLPFGFDDSGCPQYGEVFKPGEGSTIAALAAGTNTCYAADTSGNILAGTDGDWRRLGIENAQVNFFDVCLAGESLLVAGGDGRLYRYDRACENWTPLKAGEEAVHALACAGSGESDSNGERAVAVGASGHIHEQTTGRGWHRIDSPVEGDLWGIALGETDVAVGASGTIIER
jgi:hypothetical protein